MWVLRDVQCMCGLWVLRGVCVGAEGCMWVVGAEGCMCGC